MLKLDRMLRMLNRGMTGIVHLKRNKDLIAIGAVTDAPKQIRRACRETGADDFVFRQHPMPDARLMELRKIWPGVKVWER